MIIQRPSSRQPLPKDAKLVFKGILFDVYQWQQRMFDGSVATFEKLKRPDTVMVIPVTKDKKIVLTRQEQPGKKPFIGLAGGRMDPGEVVLETAKRELREETGMDAEEFVLFDAIQPTSKIDWAVYTLIAKGCRKIDELHLDAGEKIELEVVEFEQFVDYVLDNSFNDTEIKISFLEARLDPKKMEKIRNLFLN